MATCTGDQNIQNIDRNECLGNSLVTINNNFKNLDIAICETNNAITDLEQSFFNSLTSLETSIRQITDAPPVPQIRAFVSFNTSTAATPSNSIYLTPGTYTWTAPAGVTQVSARIVGGGGGGGGYVAGGKSFTSLGGGGGGGGANLNQNVTVIPGTSYTIVVGAGGRGGLGALGDAQDGTNGQDSKFGSITAGGGKKGTSTRESTNPSSINLGGDPGSPSGGTRGQHGTEGGAGGSSFGSGGNTQQKNAAANSGGGGQGGKTSPAAGTGGNGGSGRVELTYTTSGTTSIQIAETYRINQVLRTSIGTYTIKFDTGTFSNNVYAVIGTNIASATKSQNELQITTRQNGELADLSNVSLIMI